MSDASSSEVPNRPAAGWYAGDTVGQERWWDGAAWTEHVRVSAASGSRIQWGGNPEASMAAGILCGIGSGIALLIFVIAMLTGGGIESFMLLIAVLALGAFAAVGIANSRGVRRQRQQPPSR